MKGYVTRDSLEKAGLSLGDLLTKRSLELFIDYAKDAGNWNGMPLVGGNIGGSKADRGNLTQLKRAGLIQTQVDEGQTWVIFTEAGIALARSLGIEVR